MILNDAAICALSERLSQPEAQASSHWKEYLRGFRYSDGTIAGVQGADGHTPTKSLGHRIGYYILQAPFRRMGTRFASFRKYRRAGNAVVNRRGGLFDLAMMRQVLTLSLINEHSPLDQMDQPIVIIGDGWGAMTSLIHSCLPQSKVVVVNLAKMLLVDLIYIRKAFPNINICLARDADEYQSALDDNRIPVIGVCASDSTVIGGGV